MPDDFDYSQPVKRNRMFNGFVPWITMTLITFSAVFTTAYWTAPHDDLVNPLSQLVRAILPTPSQIWDQHYLGLLSSFFIHIDVMHLLFNMLWLWRLGVTLERTVPPWQYLLFFVVSTVVSSCCELCLSGQTGVGASGMVYALMGLLWGGGGFHEAWRQAANRDNMRLFLIWGVFCIFLTVSHTMNVGNGAHFGGLLFGLAVGYLFYAPRRKWQWTPALLFLAVVCVFSLTWMPWNSSWNWHKGGQAFEKHRYSLAAHYYERALRLGGDPQGLWMNIAMSQYYLAQDAAAHNRMEAAREAGARFEEALKAMSTNTDADNPPDEEQVKSLGAMKEALDKLLHKAPDAKTH